MDQDTLTAVYHGYIDYLNARKWATLGNFVAADVVHNGLAPGLTGYRARLEQNVRDTPICASKRRYS